MSKSVKDIYYEDTVHQFATPEILLGPWTSYSLVNDPKHMCFVLSRYKFCAKMLESKKTIMEIGSGDGFGLPIVAFQSERVYAVDWDERLLNGIKKRYSHINNVEYIHKDLNTEPLDIKVDGAYAIDVIEHIDPSTEDTFMENIVRSLKENAILIMGTPNIIAAKYATESSEIQHCNLKSKQTLHILMTKYFTNVLMFGMNDEVLHTGFSEMCHYLFAVGVGKKG